MMVWWQWTKEGDNQSRMDWIYFGTIWWIGPSRLKKFSWPDLFFLSSSRPVYSRTGKQKVVWTFFGREGRDYLSGHLLYNFLCAATGQQLERRQPDRLKVYCLFRQLVARNDSIVSFHVVNLIRPHNQRLTRPLIDSKHFLVLPSFNHSFWKDTLATTSNLWTCHGSW